MKKITFLVLSFLTYFNLFSQTNEIEPNDLCSQAQILNGGHTTYTGSLSSAVDVDLWYIPINNPNTLPVNINYTFNTGPANYNYEIKDMSTSNICDSSSYHSSTNDTVTITNSSGFFDSLSTPTYFLIIKINSSGGSTGNYSFTINSSTESLLPTPNPGGVAGTNLWLKANSGISNSGSNVSGWVDQSGVNAFSLTGTPELANNRINFNQSVVFNNTEDTSTLPSHRLEGNTVITMREAFAVYSSYSSIQRGALVGGTSSTGLDYGPGIFTSPSSDFQVLVSNGIAGSFSNYTNPLLENGFYLNNYSLVQPSDHIGRLNGLNQSIPFLSDPVFLPFGQVTLTPMIGGTNNLDGARPQDGENAFNGEVAEIIFFPTPLNNGDRNKIESYLAIKYGITLDPSVSQYVSSTGANLWNNNTYWNDVFGIGKDDTSQLNQPRSNSINTGSGDGTGQSGKGNIVLSSPSSLDNNDFLLIGHDNAPLTEQSTDLPSTFGKRIGREWFVKQIGNVGTINMSFNVNGLTISGTTLSRFKLLVDSDSNFSTGATTIDPTSYAGGILQFNAINLPDGSYFTIVTDTYTNTIQTANLWLKANSGTSNSGINLTGWVDQTSTNTFSVVGSPGYKTDAINFNSAVTFNNNTSLTSLALNRLDGNTNISFVDGFSVFKHTNSNSNFIGSTTPGGNYGVAIFASAGLDSNYVGNGDENKYSSFTAAGLTNSYSLVNIDVSLVASPYATGSYNGANQTFTNASGADFSNIVFTPSIGGTNNNGVSYGWNHGQGELAEVILFPSSLSSADKLKIQSYLAIKYGINLSASLVNYVDSSGNPIWNNTTYWNDVFGIGKDDTNQLNQPQSNSINTGSGDGTGQSGKGNIVLSSPSSLDNNDFLLIGHDNGTLIETTTSLPASEVGKTRLSRSWKIRRTGDVGTINLSFDLTGLCLSGSANTDYKILIDTDGNGDFTNGTVNGIVSSSFSNNKLVFDNIMLPDNAVFTFSGTAVSSSLTSAVGTDNQTLCVSSALTDITYATVGATGIGTVSGLPNGVNALWASNVLTISGTPTVSGVFNYSVKLTGSCANSDISGTINVNLNTASAPSLSPVGCVNSPMTTVTHTTTGATGIGSATGLPNGVTASWSSNTITISGTPTSSGTFNYTIPLTGGCGSVNATGTIIVSGLSSITLTSAGSTANQSVCQNNAIIDIVYHITDATGATFSGLPAGVTGSYLAGVYTISGTPSVNGSFNYTVTTSGGCAPNANAFGTISVFNSPTPTGSSTQTINEANVSDATIEDLVVTGNSIAWYGSLADANVPTNALSAGTVLVDGNTYYAVNFENGCYSSPFAVTVTVTLGALSFDKNELKVYPNPNEGTIYIDFSSVQDNLKIEIVNLIGQLVYIKNYKSVDKVEVDFSAPSGVYLINIFSEDKSKTFKIIKK